jgi:arginine decarboxylase
LQRPAPPLVTNIWETYQAVSAKNLLESYHDAVEYKDQVLQLFNLGHLSLEHRVLCENLFWAICEKVLMLVRNQPHVPEELEGLEKALSDTYFCNFSMFQSLPDIWAIDQLFPIMPIHRLDEEPVRRGSIQDVTCDSDGKIDRFVGDKSGNPSLELHEFRDGEPYMLGVFLTGAYQEILGDLHNLFGDTNAVHIRLAQNGGYEVTDLVHGDTVTEVLNYVQFRASDLLQTFRRKVAAAKHISRQEANTFIADYVAGLEGYTYLEGEAAQ